MQKKLWICLILSKNLYLKYRFFALFRRVSWLLAHLARNPCSRNRSCERNRELTESQFVSSRFPSLFALVFSVDKLFDVFMLFFMELLNLFIEAWIFRGNEFVFTSLWISMVKQNRLKEVQVLCKESRHGKQHDKNCNTRQRIDLRHNERTNAQKGSPTVHQKNCLALVITVSH